MSKEERHRVKIKFEEPYGVDPSSGVSVELICPESCHWCKLAKEFRESGADTLRGEVTVEVDQMVLSGKRYEIVTARISGVVDTEAARP